MIYLELRSIIIVLTVLSIRKTMEFPDLSPINSDSDMDVDGDSYLGEFLEELPELGDFVPFPHYDESEPTREAKKLTDTTGKGPIKVGPITESELEKCCICMENFDGTRNTELKCGHRFHTDCILANIATASSNKCPLCRDEMCGEISTIKVKALEEQLVALENTLYSEHMRYGHVHDAMIYFHDEADMCDEEVIRLKYNRKVLLKENTAVWRALERSQTKLSSAAELNPSAYKKCGHCNQSGHNIQMCAKRQNTIARRGGYIKKSEREYSRVRARRAQLDYYLTFPTNYTSDTDILVSVLPGGDLYDDINEHFE